MTLLAIGGWLAAALIAGLAVYGGVTFLDRLESFVARKLAEDALGHEAHGDVINVPSHFGTHTRTEA